MLIKKTCTDIIDIDRLLTKVIGTIFGFKIYLWLFNYLKIQ